MLFREVPIRDNWMHSIRRFVVRNRRRTGIFVVFMATYVAVVVGSDVPILPGICAAFLVALAAALGGHQGGVTELLFACAFMIAVCVYRLAAG